jgi:succinoglycan biosynthesis protein ExoA
MNGKTAIGPDLAPFVTVIIPCRNERNFVGEALDSVLANDWPADRMEVLVVDGLSDDGTRDVVRAYADRDSRVQLLDNPGLFAGDAMNLGIGAAEGDIIARLDAHGTVPPDYLREAAAILAKRPDVWAVGGPMTRVGIDRDSRLVAAITSSDFSTGNAARRGGDYEGPIDAVAFPVWRRDVFARVGKFDEAFVRNQDDDFDMRLRGAGGVVFQTPRMRVRYFVRGTASRLLRQYFQYGAWKVVLLKKHGRLPGWTPLAPPAFFAALALGLGAGFVTPWAWLAVAALAGIYFIADVIASAGVAARTSFRNLFKTFAVFPALHLAYAAGVVAGIWYSYARGFSAYDIRRGGKLSSLTR